MINADALIAAVDAFEAVFTGHNTVTAVRAAIERYKLDAPGEEPPRIAARFNHCEGCKWPNICGELECCWKDKL